MIESLSVGYLWKRPGHSVSRLNTIYHLCGKRSPFSLMWSNNSVALVIERLQGHRIRGNFLLYYQVIETYFREEQIKQVITQDGSLVSRTRRFDYSMTHVPFWSTGRHTTHVIHLLGARMRSLDLGVNIKISKTDFRIDVFEGPGYVESYRHPAESVLFNGEMIYFVAFQAHVKIRCRHIPCKTLHLYYIWQLVKANKKILVRSSEHLEISLSNCDTYYVNKLLFCAYALSSQPENGHMRVIFETLFFKGPDFLGFVQGEQRCTLAGVTVADYYRYYTIRADESTPSMMHFFLDRSVKVDFVIDAIFPELTSCYKMLSKQDTKSKSTSYVLPMKTFISTSSSIVLFIYAYGPYVNIEESVLKLRVETSLCLGLMFGCYDLPGRGFVQFGFEPRSTPELWEELNDSYCLSGTMLLAHFLSSFLGGSNRLHLVFCTQYKTDLTSVYVEIRLHSSQTPCISMQKNLNDHLRETSTCRVSERQLPALPVVITNHVTAVYYVNMYCNDMSKVSSLYDEKPNYIMINGESTVFVPRCVWLQIDFRIVCFSVEIINGNLSDSRILRDIQDGSYEAACQVSNIRIFGNSTTNRVHVKQSYSLNNLNEVTSTDNVIDEVTIFNLNWNLGNSELQLNLSVGYQCPVRCRELELHLAYMEPIKKNIVILHWNMQLITGWRNITVSQLFAPYSPCLAYILSHSTPCTEVLCPKKLEVANYKNVEPTRNIHSLDSAKSIASYAEYVLLWTSDELSWYGAEHSCMQLGMHLASISSEEEYRLVTGMLSGDGYGTYSHLEQRILTPCRTVSSLCIVYIGMQLKVKNS